ncbi:MAG: putative dsRNA-binding protein [Bacteroides graminisolvens]
MSLLNSSLTKTPIRYFKTEIMIEGLSAGTGTGYSKKESQQNAAQMALKKIKTNPEFISSIENIKIDRTTLYRYSRSKRSRQHPCSAY